MTETKFTILEDKKTLLVERVFPASKDKVWAAWTIPKLFAQWFGPKDWSTTVKQMDFEEGGVLIYGMTCDDPEQKDWYGKTSWGKTVYQKIDAKNSITYSDEFCDENGTVMEGMPVMNIHVKFEAINGSTKVSSTTEFASAEALQQIIAMGMQEGLTQTWDRLEELLSQ